MSINSVNAGQRHHYVLRVRQFSPAAEDSSRQTTAHEAFSRQEQLAELTPSFQPCLPRQGDGEGGREEACRLSGDAQPGRRITVSIPSQPLHGDCPHEDPQ